MAWLLPVLRGLAEAAWRRQVPVRQIRALGLQHPVGEQRNRELVLLPLAPGELIPGQGPPCPVLVPRHPVGEQRNPELVRQSLAPGELIPGPE